MSIFDTLPNVEKCCYCIGLKWGTVIIAAIGIINMFTFSFATQYQCSNQKEKTMEMIMHYVFYVVALAMILLFIASIGLIIGVFMHKPITATIFLYVALIATILELIYIILKAVASVTHKGCPFAYMSIVSAIIGFLIWIYFITVVKSYHKEMDDNED